ncbi:MAG TPA: prepilin-type N-terminal cleavage/methylation domain-containing protein [Verrucomicrobiae bacterium]|nr:prepilin-type N-terminal cleavage/methylation domain-containing protein [Verrucomicrobiae bacterium]
MKCAVPGWASRAGNFARAFTLLEVMIALMIFFMAIFAILGTVTRSLGAARSLQQKFPDIDALGAEVIMTLKTNKLEEGSVDGDFGDLYPGYTWRRDINLKATNGLFQVDFIIQSSRGRQRVEWTNSILAWDTRWSSFGRRP